MRDLPLLAPGIRLVFRAAPGWAVVSYVLLAVQGLLPVATVYLVRLLVDSLVLALESDGAWAEVQPAVMAAAAMAAVLLLGEVLTSLTVWVKATQADLVQDHIAALVQGQSRRLDLAFYESPEYFDRMYRARVDALGRSVMMIDNLATLAQNCITLIAMAVVLVPYGWWLPLVLFIGTLPAFWVVLGYSIRHYDWRHRVTQDERLASYYDRIVCGRESAAELRVFGFGVYFSEAYDALRKRLRGERYRLNRDQVVSLLFAGVFGLVTTAGALAWMGWKVLHGPQTLGDLALFYQAFNKGQGLFRSLMTSVGRIYGDILFLGALFQFLELEPKVTDSPDAGDEEVQIAREVRFREVTFSYPGAEKPVLEGFNLVIPAGKVVAIVGTNGAGKSTLFKLICRLYDPSSGAVEIDGREIREISLERLRQAVSVLFQEPMHYYVSVAKNIELGDIRQQANRDRVEACARAAGSDRMIRGLPDGYDTLLGRWWKNGRELSVGQWQQLALARAFLRSSPLILLDEPTSPMDSWFESEWMDRFRRLAEGKTAVIITHRLSTAMRADVVHVMVDGRIVESGSHDELLAMRGRYAEAWTTQYEGRDRG